MNLSYWWPAGRCARCGMYDVACCLLSTVNISAACWVLSGVQLILMLYLLVLTITLCMFGTFHNIAGLMVSLTTASDSAVDSTLMLLPCCWFMFCLTRLFFQRSHHSRCRSHQKESLRIADVRFLQAGCHSFTSQQCQSTKSIIKC